MALLPVSIAVGLLLWYLDTDFSLGSCLTIVTLIISTFTLRVFSNAVQLIRVRSWTVSSIYIILAPLCCHTYGWSIATAIGGLLFMVYIIALLASYQEERPQTNTFIAILSLAVLTFHMPQLLWMVPISILATLTTLRTFSTRTLLAIFFGLALPMEIFFAWHVYLGNATDWFLSLAQGLVGFSLPSVFYTTDLKAFAEGYRPTPTDLTMALMCLYGLIGIAHFVHTSYNDKIRTRMHFITIIMHWPALLLLLIFTQSDTPLLLAMMTLLNSILLAHYFVFSKGWIANSLFWLFVISCICLALPLF